MTTRKAAADSVFDATPIALALKAMYRVTSGMSDFIEKHIEDLKRSPDHVVASTGRVLEAAKHGLFIGYIAPVAAIALGQLLLGNPFSAVFGAAAMAVNPVAMSCAAVGAIWMGWRALSPQDQAVILEKASAGLRLAVEQLRLVIDLVLRMSQSILGSRGMEALKQFVAAQAESFGRTLSSITGNLPDWLKDLWSKKVHIPLGGTAALTDVLARMDRAQLELLLRAAGFSAGDDQVSDSQLREHIAEEISAAGAYSWPWASRPDYPEVVAMVAERLDLPTPAGAHVRDLERVILFKLIELSLEKLDDKKKAELVASVEGQLRERGIEGKVAFSEIVKFVKFGGMDIGGTLGGLVLGAPGMYGVIGLNFLQFAILKGIILTSGYFAAGTSLLGFGAGGFMLALAGAAAPAAAALAVVFTAHTLAGPAFRKIVPAVCVVAAKRLEQDQETPTLPTAERRRSDRAPTRKRRSGTAPLLENGRSDG